MIVKNYGDTLDNYPQAYKELFQKAENALDLDSGTIQSLEKYFEYLPDLVDSDDPSTLIYTAIPLLEEEEPVFEINANTRQIKVPNALKMAGVKGDYTAEIVYFTIDRYFDAVDLADMTAVIEWRKSGSKQGYVSKAYLTDINRFPGKILIGWPLADEITSTAGIIEFSLRFYHTGSVNGETVIDYSFNTLPATITISDTIDVNLLDMEDEILDVNSVIVQRIISNKATTGEENI